MTKISCDIDKTIAKVERLLADDKQVSSALRVAVLMLISVVKLLANRLNLNSRNSSKPPSSDPNRVKKSRAKSKRPVGGQPGHDGTTLYKVDDPDEIKQLKVDRRKLPRGQYQDAGVESRQVFDIRITRHVTEYQAQVLEDAQGRRFVAEFPEQVARPVQYGCSVKAQAVYLSMFQLVPYARTQSQFAEVYQIPLSAGTLFNFNREASERLRPFLELCKQQLAQGKTINADETGAAFT